MLLRTLATGIMFVLATSAFATTDESNQGQGQGQGQTKLSLDDLKAKCRDLAADPQRKPISAKITCSDLGNKWDQTQQGKGKLKNARKVGAQVSMKGWTVAQQFSNHKVKDTEIACPQYVKVEKIVDSVEQDVSCDDLLKIDDLGTFCAALVDQRVADDEGIVKYNVTNEVTSLCPQ